MRPADLIVTPELVEAAREYFMTAWEGSLPLTEKLAQDEPDVSADGAKMLAYASLFIGHAKLLGADIAHALSAAAELLGQDNPGRMGSIH